MAKKCEDGHFDPFLGQFSHFFPGGAKIHFSAILSTSPKWGLYRAIGIANLVRVWIAWESREVSFWSLLLGCLQTHP